MRKSDSENPLKYYTSSGRQIANQYILLCLKLNVSTELLQYSLHQLGSDEGKYTCF